MLADVGAPAADDEDEALVREHPHRFAGSQPGHAELADQLRLRRHWAARLVHPGLDPAPENRSYLPVDRRGAIMINGHPADRTQAIRVPVWALSP